jgi:hypothetical protein
LSVKKLFATGVHEPVANILPGKFFYCSMSFSYAALREYPKLTEQLTRMSDGLQQPKVSFWREDLEPGGHFGPTRMHTDGKGDSSEIHRLFIVGGLPTEAHDGSLLQTGAVWEYSGDFVHRGLPVTQPCQRLMLRVSQTTMHTRETFCLRTKHKK